MSIDNIELSSKNYWDDLWEDVDCQGTYIFNQKNPSYVLNYKKHVIMKNYLSDVPEGSSFLEVGCGASKFLAYVSQQFHFDVSGIDYSEEGCNKARKILENNEVEGTIILGDMFNLSKDEHYRGRFDVVYTGGVIEHFDDTNHVVKTISDFAGDGGYVITTVPNTWKKSLNMIIQKVISKETYDTHKELSLSDIRDAHEKAGLSVLICEYVCFYFYIPLFLYLNYTIFLQFTQVFRQIFPCHFPKYLVKILYIRKSYHIGNLVFICAAFPQQFFCLTNPEFF